ncbi:type IV pilin protein [Glaciecola sp. KUL10]|uniref:type IV pilin protein n=1 Tax=Glaciecola sp. (strain KUL10) TaxID=2161813 RepID=UPI000D7840FF|nr:type IV pilin protein [Glaciecola sp. KUL10]GBL04704.1 general secretion pathway protein H [Glaciecola sp. KUL10]
MNKSNQNGFTLVELMIVVGIVGIIASIAYPSYQSMINNTARSTAQGDLMSLATALERHNVSNFTYNGAAASGANTGTPAIYAAYSPATESVANKKYDLSIDSVAANGLSYVIKATPVSGSSTEGTGALFMFSDGRKAWDKSNDGTLGIDEYCWSC